jgi:hypothetical protein
VLTLNGELAQPPPVDVYVGLAVKHPSDFKVDE